MSVRSITTRRKWSILIPPIGGFIVTLSFVGALCGLLLGGLTVLWLEHRRPRLCEESEVQQGLSLPVLSAIPLIESERERRLRRSRDLAAILALLIAAAVAVFLRSGR